MIASAERDGVRDAEAPAAAKVGREYQADNLNDPVTVDAREMFYGYLQNSAGAFELFDAGCQLGICVYEPPGTKRVAARIVLTANREELRRRVHDAVGTLKAAVRNP